MEIDEATEIITDVLMEKGAAKRKKFIEEVKKETKEKANDSIGKQDHKKENKKGLKKVNSLLKIKYIETEGKKARYMLKEEGVEARKDNSIVCYKTPEEVKQAIDEAIKEIIEEGEEILAAFEMRDKYVKHS